MNYLMYNILKCQSVILSDKTLSNNQLEQFLMAQHTQAEICQVPKILELDYHYEQQLTSVVTITNTLDKIVTYKIKSNKPELYLVKPMEGSIYRYDSIKITFKRKQLLKKDFETYLRNPSAFPQQKFLVEIKYSQKDAIGREKIISQSAYISVRFRAPQSTNSSFRKNKQQQTPLIPSTKLQREDEVRVLNEKKQQKLQQLKKLEIELKQTSKNKASSLKSIDLTDLIVLLLLAFMIGFSF